MHFKVYLLGFVCLFIGLLACAPQVASKSVQNPPPASTAASVLPSTQPQSLIDAKLGTYTIQLELAITPKTRQTGLMFRKHMPENQGMLFVFEQEQQLSFWMKNTFIPLSIAYLDKDFKIVDIQDMKPLDETGHPSKAPAQYALEMNQGWFKAKNIQIGAILELNKDELKSPQPQ